MEHKITFDLNLLELALDKAIENLQTESKLLMQINIKPDDLDRVANEKDDIMNFIEWHIPIIVRYIKMHKKDLDDINDLSQLYIRSKALNQTAQANIQEKINIKSQITTGMVSTISIIAPQSNNQPPLDIMFINDSIETPKRLTNLLKNLFSELENNLHKLTARKKLNDQIFNLVSQTLKSEQKVSYSPKRRKEIMHSSNIIYSEEV